MSFASKIFVGFLALVGMLIACTGVEKYGSAAYYDQHVRDKIDVIMPPNALYISQQFRFDDDKKHQGIDIWGKKGTPVLAAAPGRVTRSFYEPAYGNRIVIEHGRNADGEQLFTVYKHLDTRGVEEGAQVARAQKIGTMGDTGALGLMVHLHFETMRKAQRKGEVYYDPHYVWADGVGRVTCFDSSRTYGSAPFVTTYPTPCR